MSYQVQADGALTDKQEFYHLHTPDAFGDAGAWGMCVDRDGRLYVATWMGIQICDPRGWVNCIVPLPSAMHAEYPSSVCLGGRNFDTLYVTCGPHVYSRKVKTHGVYGFMEPTKPAPHL